MRKWRRPVAIAAIPILLGLVGNLAANTVAVEASWWKPTVWTATIVLALAALAIGARASAPSSVIPGADGVAEAAEWLAQALREQYVQAEEQRQVHTPPVLTTRFRPAPESLFDSWPNIRLAPLGSHPGPLKLAGTLSEIARSYARIPSGRLVVLGAAGAGKTVLVTRLARELLAGRRSGAPVPVIFEARSWDPARPLREWMIEQLADNHRPLARSSGPESPSLAAQLVGGGQIRPILDGLDDIAAGLRRPAIEQLNLAAAVPVVVTCRPEEYAALMAEGPVLRAAAGIELPGLTRADLAQYLPRINPPASTGTDPAGWASVLARLRSHGTDPESAVLAEALSTPLTVHLFRAVYADGAGRDPAELLDRSRFPSATDIRQYLLGSFIPAAYSSPTQWPAEAVPRWLGFLARHGGERRSPDVAWWQLRDRVPRVLRVLSFGLVHAAATFLTLALFQWLFSHFSGQRQAAPWPMLAASGVVALTGGLYTGWPSVGPLPAQTRARVPGRVRDLFVEFTVVFFVAKASFLPLKLLLLAIGGWSLSFTFGTLPSIALAMSTAVTVLLLHFAEAPAAADRVGSPLVSIKASRRSVLLRSGATTVAAIVGIGGVFGAFGGLTVGLVAAGVALPARLAYVLTSTAWGQWCMLTRPYLALTGRLPWRIIRFLEDARERGVLRPSGAVYQFRHDELRRRLADTTR